MAEYLSSRRTEIEGKDKAAVKALLDEPVRVSYWKNTRPPENATAAEITAFKQEQLDEIWIYLNGRVHFTLAGIAKKVDDKVTRDLGPEDPPLTA